MPNKIDDTVSQAIATLRAMFLQLELSDEEIQFVRDAGVAIAEHSYNLLSSLPQETVMRLRPIVMVVAIAHAIGADTEITEMRKTHKR